MHNNIPANEKMTFAVEQPSFSQSVNEKIRTLNQLSQFHYNAILD